MPNPFALCRQNIGVAPRQFTRAQNKNLLTKAPDWLKQHPLHCVARDRELLLREGRIAAGALVQANRSLWQPGEIDSLALALWSEDPRPETDACRLRELALELRALKGLTPEGAEEIAPGMAPFAAHITSETSSPLNLKLPPDWGAQGAQFYMSAIVIWRAHLPARYLTSHSIPLLVLPERTDAVMLLPGMFWSDALKDR